MRRREFLALSGSLAAGFAGCLSPFDAGAESATRTTDPATGSATTGTTPEDSPLTDPDSTTEPNSTTATAADASVSVRIDALQPAMVSMTTPDSIGVRRDDGQYLLLDVAAEGDVVPSRDDFSFRFAGTTHRPVATDHSWRIWRFYGEKNWEYDSSGEGVLLFELPESADSAAPADPPDSPEAVLTWPGGEWIPDASIRERLVTPTPPLSVSFGVTEEIPTSESPTVEVSVRNDGDVPGRFVAGLNRSGPRVDHTPVERVSVLVPAGETETWELTDYAAGGPYDSERVGDGEPNMVYYLSWADDSLQRAVRYVD